MPTEMANCQDYFAFVGALLMNSTSVKRSQFKWEKFEFAANHLGGCRVCILAQQFMGSRC